MSAAESVLKERQHALQLHQTGALKQAEKCYQAILTAHPEDGETWHLLAVLYGQLELHQQVVDCCRRALQAGYSKASVFANLGLAHQQLGEASAAKTALQQSLGMDATDADLTLEYLALLMAEGDERAALHCAGDACARFAQDERMHTEMGRLAVSLNDGQLAEESFRHALRLQPESFELWLNLGSILLLRGDMPGAEYAYRKALEINCNSPEAWWFLSQLASAKADEKVGAHILRWAAKDNSPASAPVHFAAALILDEEGQTDAAFQAWSKGNRLVRGSYEYRVENDLADLQQLANALGDFDWAVGPSTQRPEQVTKTDSPMPIFIVGMPRSGSTLLEQQLTRHSNIDNGGENVWLQRFIVRAMKRSGLRYPAEQLALEDQAIDEIRARYMESLSLRVRQGCFITDKLPGNFAGIPTIRRLFPAALILHARRDEMETCWSCYRHLFSARQSFAYDLVELGHYCAAAHQFIDNCHALWPNQVMNVPYEMLVSQPERTLASIAEKLGLHWLPNVLAATADSDFIQTASSTQLRTGMAQQAMSSCQRYLAHLAPLQQALQRASISPGQG